MSNQNRFLLPHTAAATGSARSDPAPHGNNQHQPSSSPQLDQENNQLSVDTDFDSYWEEEARNPNRNRIRIGRQYQATVPPLLKSGEKDRRKLEDLETLSFCPKRSAKVSNGELDHYFTVAKSLNLFASLVETRSLLGRDVTIADLNHIRHKEGLSLASVIQPVRQSATNISPQSSQLNTSNSTAQAGGSSQQTPTKSPLTAGDNNKPSSTSALSPKQALTTYEDFVPNQPLMKALSHFISLHHPCHHDANCKKLLKDVPFIADNEPAVSITAGNLRQGTSKDSKISRSRHSSKQQSHPTTLPIKSEDLDSSNKDPDGQDQASGENIQSPTFEEWTREEVELFSKAIEVCGKNFSSIKKEFLPSKSVRSIVEYYYIGSRDVSDGKKKTGQAIESGDCCSSPEKSATNNNGQGGAGGGSGGFSAGGKNGSGGTLNESTNQASSSSRASSNFNGDSHNNNKSSLSEIEETNKKTAASQELFNRITSNDFKKCEDSLGSNNKNSKSKTNIDARMSIYNFDEDFKDESPLRFECPRPGAEIKPLNAKPILQNPSLDSEAGNSNVGSLKFFMDGQLILKLNACQEQQEGIEKCHWVQSSDKVNSTNNRQKRYTKKANDRSSQDPNHNGSESNSIISSNQDDGSKHEDMTADEDSKESANSFTNVTTPRNKSQSASPSPRRSRAKQDSNNSTQQQQQNRQQSSQGPAQTPIDYNRLAVNNRMKERNDTMSQSALVNQAAAMPWLQANPFAFAAALLGGLPFPGPAGSLVPPQQQINSGPMNVTSKPMDLSLEHNNSPKPIQSKPSSRSKSSRPKNT